MNLKYIDKNQNRMELQEKDGVYYFTFPAFANCKELRHLFTTRLGGVSTGDFTSMNLSFSRGDVKEAVIENYRRIANVLECKITDFVCSDQTHTTNIRKVTVNDRGKGITCEKDYRDVDGLITNEEGIVLVTIFADCVPLYFYDPIKKVIGLAHSGWKGTVGKIGKCMVEAMSHTFGSNASDILVGIGPCICQDCYEISKDVAEQFYHNFTNVEKNGIITKGNVEDKFQLNLVAANKQIFLESGILEQNILVSNVCTSCNKETLFSHRASQGKRGNLGAFIGLKNL